MKKLSPQKIAIIVVIIAALGVLTFILIKNFAKNPAVNSTQGNNPTTTAQAGDRNE